MADTYFNREANTGAVNGRVTRDYNEYLRWGGPSLDQPSGSQAPDYEGQRRMALEAVQPVVSSLQASIPEIQNKFTSAQTQIGNEKQPLKDRYDQLLNDIKGREASQVNDATQIATREFARRGLTADSTFVAQEIAGRTAPIRGQAQSDILSTTFDRESKLREIDNTISNLTTEMVSAERGVKNTIAQIQATAGTDAANRALEMYKVQKQEQENALNRLLQERQLSAQEEQNKFTNSIASGQLANQTAQTKYDTSKPYYQPTDTNNILSLLGLGGATTEPKPTAPGGGISSGKNQNMSPRYTLVP